MFISFFKKRKSGGYILLEIVVALGIFMAVMTIGMSAVLVLFDSNKRAKDLKSIINNLNVAMDSMTRELVVGTNYGCNDDDIITPEDCDISGGEAITFCSSEDYPISYRFNVSNIERRIGEVDGGGVCEEGASITWEQAGWVRITAPEVIIEDLKFYVSGSTDENLQPRVLVNARGIAGDTGRQTEFEVQTTVSQRVPDLSIAE